MQSLEQRRLLAVGPPLIADAGADRVAAAGVAVKLRIGAPDPAVQVPKLILNYGDGTPETVLNNLFLRDPLQFAHTYTQKGEYIVTLTIEDAEGAVSTDTAQVTVGDVVAHLFEDVNGDGAQHFDNDHSIASRTVWIDSNDNGSIDNGEFAAATDSFGDALFDGVAPGTYQIRAEIPDGWQVSFADGSIRGDACAATINEALGAGCTFGFTQRAMLTGIIFHDLNSNGVRDPGEPRPSAGVGAFNLAGNRVGLSAGFSDGFYRIRGLVPGTYRILPVSGNEWLQTFPAAPYEITVSSGQTLENVDYGFVLTATARGFVFEDIDSDGLYHDPDRIYTNNNNIPQTIYFDANDNGVHDANERKFDSRDGNWWIDYIPPGLRTFRLLPPPGWIETTAGATINFQPGDVIYEIKLGAHKTDNTPPQVTNFIFRHDLKPQAIEFTFSEPVEVVSDGLTVRASDNSRVLFDLASYDPAQQKAIFTPHSSAVLADGNYLAGLSGYFDVAGNSSGSGWLPLFVLKGDLNRDREVSIADFITLSSNFGKTNATWADGDVNCDGEVSIADFIELSANFNASLTPPAAPAAAELSSQTAPTAERVKPSRSHKPTPRRRPHHRRNIRPMLLFRHRD